MLSLRRCYNKMYIDVSAFVLFPSFAGLHSTKVTHNNVIKVSQQHLLFTGPYFYLHQKVTTPSLPQVLKCTYVLSHLKSQKAYAFLFFIDKNQVSFCHSLLPGVRTHVFARTLLFETC
jgi:hypothetical protein